MQATMQGTADILDAGQLFETHHDRIYRYVLHLVHNPAEAEDLTQDTFLRAYLIVTHCATLMRCVAGCIVLPPICALIAYASVSCRFQ